MSLPKKDWMYFKAKCVDVNADDWASVALRLFKLFNKHGNRVFDIDNEAAKFLRDYKEK